MSKYFTLTLILLLNFSAMANECDKGHRVHKNTSDGSIVTLEDGSTWEIAPTDRGYTVKWTPGTNITACVAKLINVDGGEAAEAIRIK